MSPRMRRERAGTVLKDSDYAVGFAAVGVDADVVVDGVAGFAEFGGDES